MSISTDAMYNARSRYLHQMLKIHFSPSEVLEVYKDKYLVSSSIFEESYKMADSPFGDVTSNELSFTLFNNDGIFNPSNTSGKYYGLIKKGVKIEAFIRPDEVDEWDLMGVFYVTDWYTTASALTAEVTANDILHNVLNGPVPSMPVYRNIPFKEFVVIYFAYFGYEVIVDDSINYIIPYVYTSSYSDNKSFLTDLMKSALADCICGHDGKIRILSKIADRVTRAKFTDNDQIVNVSIKQSITTNYDSVAVTCNKSQESTEQVLVDLADMMLTPGVNSTGKLSFSKQPALSIKSVSTDGNDSLKILSYEASAKDFVGNIRSTANTSTNLIVKGTVIDTVAITIGEAKETPLSIDSPFIQKEDVAETIRKYTEAYIEANLPVLELQVRGNPKIELGSMIEVDSNFYKTKYTGILINASYDYAGKLTCRLTLIDASMLEEV